MGDRRLIPYSRRLARRHELWWGRPRPGGRRAGDVLHQVLGEQRASRSREDPDAAWRCCRSWPRTLLRKDNAREFAARHGCVVPVLHWRGSDPAAAPLEALGGAFVLRPVAGAASHGVLVVAGGRDLMRGVSASPAEVRAQFPPRRRGRRPPVLLEERVKPREPGRALPVELKVHVFGGTVALLERVQRWGFGRDAGRWYTPEWEPLSDPMNVRTPQDAAVAAPADLAEMLAAAARLGAAIGTYMRIDFFAAEDGLVFNEFSATPMRGVGFTPHADDLLSRTWAGVLGDTV